MSTEVQNPVENTDVNADQEPQIQTQEQDTQQQEIVNNNEVQNNSSEQNPVDQEPETQAQEQETQEQEVVNNNEEQSEPAQQNPVENTEAPVSQESEVQAKEQEPETQQEETQEQEGINNNEVQNDVVEQKPAENTEAHVDQKPETQAQPQEIQQEETQKQQEVVNTNEVPAHHQEIDNAETKVFTDLFNAYDTGKTGKIKAEHLYEIATMVGKESRNVDEVLEKTQKTKEDLISLEEYKKLIEELEKPEASVVESEGSVQSERVIITPDPKVLEFIKLLHAFQKKCEKEGKYGEAKLAQQKIEETKLQEILRQEHKIRMFQEEELAQVENAQRAQFEEFNKVWDKYMAEYEEKALESLEKLKEKHISEVAELHERLKRELVFHFKSSKQLIELRQKEEALVKIQKYGEAEKIKLQADTLEAYERKSKEREIEDITEKKTVALRQQQQKALSVLVKRIQKDREQQLKNREIDSQKLLLKNKNLRNELISKHAMETKNSLDVVRNNLSIVNALYLNQANKKLSNSTLSGRNSVKSGVSSESPAKLT